MILLVGATGTVGRRLTIELKARRADFRILAREPERAEKILGKANYFRGNLDLPPSWDKALTGANSLYLATPCHPDLAARETTFLAAARKAGVRRVVKISILGAAENSPFAEGREHGRIETELARGDWEYAILRPAPFMQSLLTSKTELRRGKILRTHGSGRFAPIDAGDVAQIAERALTKKDLNGVLTLTGAKTFDFAEFAQALAKVLHRPIDYVPIAEGAARDAMKRAGIPHWQTEAALESARFISSGAADVVTDVVRATLGREAKPLAEYLKENASTWDA